MVLIELAFLLFWEFGGGLETAVDMTIFEASNIAYFDAVALPYLILNKSYLLSEQLGQKFLEYHEWPQCRMVR
ncbi:unnamed protein product [Heligmosomoides polygyrus]|uniref:Glutathione S-transferase n=1 Tax=Heligmosomoides polygyrus TaxID=6339 RepID=A0A183FHI4_HELPZ|nr:unnamed protein product [Heligmosomoides polygyrus]